MLTKTQTSIIMLRTDFIMENWKPWHRTWAEELERLRAEGTLRSTAADTLKQERVVILGGDGFIHSGVPTVIAAFVKGRSLLQASLLLGKDL